MAICNGTVTEAVAYSHRGGAALPRTVDARRHANQADWRGRRVVATSGNAKLLKLSGARNSYRGDLGEVRKGALADLILVDGNLLQDLSLVGGAERKFLLIIKDGVLVKNGLAK